jgi:hypothetical protein
MALGLDERKMGMLPDGVWRFWQKPQPPIRAKRPALGAIRSFDHGAAAGSSIFPTISSFRSRL